MLPKVWKMCFVGILVVSLVSSALKTVNAQFKEGLTYEEAKPLTLLENVPKANRKYNLVFMVPTLAVYFPKMVEGAKAAAEKANVNIRFFDATNDPAKQIGQIEDTIAKGADSVILVPVEVDALVIGVKKLNKANIPVLCDNREVSGGEIIGYCGTEDRQAGLVAVELAVEALTRKYGEPKGKICIIEGWPGSSPQIHRSEAYDEVLSKYPKIEILAKDTAYWQDEKARALMENWLSRFPKIDLLLTQGDIDAWGAWYAANAVGRAKDILFIGINGWKQTTDWIKKGRMYGSAYQDPFGEGVVGVTLAVKYLNGEKIPRYVPVPCAKVNPDNVDQHPGW